VARCAGSGGVRSNADTVGSLRYGLWRVCQLRVAVACAGPMPPRGPGPLRKMPALLGLRQQVPGFDLALELDRQRLAAAIQGLAGGDADPALADAVLLHVAALDALEAHADAALERGGVVMGAARVVAEAVGGRLGHVGRGTGRCGPRL